MDQAQSSSLSSWQQHEAPTTDAPPVKTANERAAAALHIKPRVKSRVASLALSDSVLKKDFRRVVTEESLIIMSRQEIEELKKRFDEGDDDGLDEEEFIETFGMVLKTKTRQQLKHMFMKIDANSDGNVDWDEFVNFMLLENKGAEDIAENHLKFSRSHRRGELDKSNNHKKMIDVVYLWGGHVLITGGRDGMVKFWNAQTLKHLGTVSDLPGPERSPTSSVFDQTNTSAVYDMMADAKANVGWITAITYLQNSKKIVVCSMDRVITFFNPMTFERTDRIRDMGAHRHLHHAPLCCEAVNFNETKSDGTEKINWPEMLLIGDDGGNLLIYRLGDPNGDTPMAKAEWHICDREEGLTCRHYAKKEPGLFWKNVSLTRILNLHDGWITKVKYLPDLRFMVTSSLDGKIKLTDITRLGNDRTLSGIAQNCKEFTGHNKGVVSFAYSNKFKLMASCSLERQVLLWDPFSLKVSFTLENFLHAVQQVSICDRQNLLVSLCVDKSIRLYDINEVHSLKLVQVIEDPHWYRPENRLTAMAVCQKYDRIFTASSTLQLYKGNVIQDSGPRTHRSKVCAAMYNENFHQVISADVDGTVIVWDADSGQSVFRFNTGCSISSMCFDHNKRRLLTGSSDGKLIAWNFSNGQCLTEFARNSKSTTQRREITDILYILEEKDESQAKFVVSVGWDRKVCVYPDFAKPTQSAIYVMPSSKSVNASNKKVIGHHDDILCVALCRHKILATGGYDGRICMWHFDSSQFNIVMTPPNYVNIPEHQAQPEGRAVEQLLWVHSKNVLVSVGADGYLRFWDTRHGRMLMEKHGGHQQGESILALAGDQDNKYMFTGDSAGCVKIWDIRTLIDLREESHKKEDRLAYVKKMRDTHGSDWKEPDSDDDDTITPKAKKNVEYFGYDSYFNVEKELEAVVPVRFWRAHGRALSSIDFLPAHQMILTAAVDSKVLLWGMDGTLVGMFQQFNQDGWWNLDDKSSYYSRRPLPAKQKKNTGEDLLEQADAAATATTIDDGPELKSYPTLSQSQKSILTPTENAPGVAFLNSLTTRCSTGRSSSVDDPAAEARKPTKKETQQDDSFRLLSLLPKMRAVDVKPRHNHDEEEDGNEPPPPAVTQRRSSVVENYMRHHSQLTTGDEALDKELGFSTRSEAKTQSLINFAEELGIPLPHALAKKVEKSRSRMASQDLDDVTLWSASSGASHARKLTRMGHTKHKPYVRRRDRKKEKPRLRAVDVTYVPFS